MKKLKIFGIAFLFLLSMELLLAAEVAASKGDVVTSGIITFISNGIILFIIIFPIYRMVNRNKRKKPESDIIKAYNEKYKYKQ